MVDYPLDPRRLRLLVELSRLGSMREVADELGLTTSTVSQQLGVLSREAGTPLLEPQGRRVRLTPAGQRLSVHAVDILAALEAARVDLGNPPADGSTPDLHGEVRIAAHASSLRHPLLGLVTRLRSSAPGVRLRLLEHEPGEAFALLEDDAVDLALVYDFDLAPLAADERLALTPLATTSWGLGVPGPASRAGTSLEVVARYADADWIVNSRGTADESAVRTLAGMAGFTPRIVHRADSLELVEDMILAGLGVGLMLPGRPRRRGISVVRLRDPGVLQRSYLAVRRGREGWPPLALVIQELTGG